jgi:phage major head subunit gpT-like protein
MRTTFADLYEDRLPYLEELIYNAYEEYPDEYSQVFNIRTSTRMMETDFMIAEFGLFPTKQEQADITVDSIEPSYKKDYTHLTYARGVIVSMEALEDDQDNVMANQAEGLGFAGRQTVEQVAWNEGFNRGFTTALAADAAAIYGAHTTAKGVAWDNSANADLDSAGLEDALTHFHSLLDEAGKKIRMQESWLIVPPALTYQAVRLVDSVNQPGTADNDINPYRGFNLRVFTSHYLSSSSAWFVWADSRQIKAKFWWRKRPTVVSDVDYWSQAGLTALLMRYSVGVSDPRGLYGSQGS